jgi:hypothetical protein
MFCIRGLEYLHNKNLIVEVELMKAVSDADGSRETDKLDSAVGMVVVVLGWFRKTEHKKGRTLSCLCHLKIIDFLLDQFPLVYFLLLDFQIEF